MSIRLRTQPSVRHSRRAELRSLVDWIRRSLHVYHVHDLKVVMVDKDAIALSSRASKHRLGVFLYPDRPVYTDPWLRIYVAASSRFSGPEVALNLLHEFVHYEQWRDGRAINERNVERRARSLYSRYLRETNETDHLRVPASSRGHRPRSLGVAPRKEGVRARSRA